MQELIKNFITILILIFSINLSFGQKYFVLENNTDKFQMKNYELNTSDLYGINKKISIYNILLNDITKDSNTPKTLALFSVLPTIDNNENWIEISLDSIEGKLISPGKLRQLSEISLYQKDDYQYGSKTKYWNEYKIVVEKLGKYYSPKNCLLQFYTIHSRQEVFNQPYNTINISQEPHTFSNIKNMYANNFSNRPFPMGFPPDDRFFDTFRGRREFLSKKITINYYTYYQFWTFTDWGKITSKVTKDQHKVHFAYERGIDRFVYNHDKLIVGGSYDFYFYYYQQEFGISADVFQKNLLEEKVAIAEDLK